MKIQESSAAVDVKTNMQMTSIKAELAQDKLHKMWDLLQSPYRDPIASLIREYVSNGFDSHIEAGVDTPVYVSLEEDQSGWFWACEDFGVGLSETRCRDIFMKYLTSTKEETNDQIGAFGMGSKSGLGYTDVVHIRTRFDGTEYKYMLHKTTDAPTLSLVESYSTDKCNGTQVKVYLKDHWDEADRFIKKTKEQLTYFDNVHYGGRLEHLNEEFVVFKGKNFWHKPTCSFRNTHLVIGKVSYPINWENMGRTEMFLPIALSFDIGDLPVIFTREDIRYTDDAIRKIKTKIADAEEELIALASPKVKEVDDLHFYNDLVSGTPTVRFDEEHSMELGKDLGDRVDTTDIVYAPNPYLDKKVLKEGQGYRRNNISRLFSRTLANNRRLQTGRNISCQWYNVSDKYGKVSLSSSHSKRILMDEPSDPRKNRWIYKEIAQYCDLFVDNRGKLDLKEYKYILKLTRANRHTWRHQIQWYQNWQDENFENFIDYKYSEIEVPEEFEKNAKASVGRTVIGSDEIRYKEYRETETNKWRDSTDLEITSDLKKSKVDDVKSITGLVIWSTRDQEDALRCTYRLLENFAYVGPKTVISVARRDAEVMEILEEERLNIVSLDNWYLDENKLLEAFVFFEKYGTLVGSYVDRDTVYRKPAKIPYLDFANRIRNHNSYIDAYKSKLPDSFINHLVNIFHLQGKELNLDGLPALVSWRKAEKHLQTMWKRIEFQSFSGKDTRVLLAHLLAPNRPVRSSFRRIKNNLLINNL
jgi:hypothetical protein